MSWEILKAKLPDLRARKTMVTHMNPTMLARIDEARAAGVLVGHPPLDGQSPLRSARLLRNFRLSKQEAAHT